MPRSKDTASSEEPGSGPGDGGVRAAGAVPGPLQGGRSFLRRPGAWRTLCLVLACSLAFSFSPSILSSAGLHFGLISAVKSKVKELGKKIRARTAPTQLAAVALSSTSISLSWKDNAKDESGVGIERKSNESGAYITLTIAAPDTVGYIDTGLSGDVTYYYRVRAYTPAGASDYSNEASLRTLNTPPVISSVTAAAAILSTGTTTSVTCEASDADGDALVYSWQAASGTPSGTGPVFAWTAPSVPGTYKIGCTADDGRGGTDRKDAEVRVATGPVIISITPYPAKVTSGGTSDIVCVATAPGSASLTYAWTAASGTPAGTGSSFAWTAPAATGTYLVNCVVTDVYGISAFAQVEMHVSNLVISALTATPIAVEPSGVSTITCTAADPDSPVLTYAWLVDDAPYAVLPSSRIVWTAPADLGTYKITCEATNSAGDKAQRDVNVWVATGPVIISVVAAPSRVKSGAVSDLVCVATAPNGIALSYGWTAASGTHAGTGDEFAWTAPAATGTYPVYCEVSGGGGTASKSAEVQVSNLEITAMTAAPGIVYKSGVSTITCAAEDSASSALTYSWVVPDGEYAVLDSSRIAWTAPPYVGAFTIGCEVSNEAGDKAQREAEVLVATGPVIISVNASPLKVPSGGLSSVVCLATAPGGVALTYGWSAASGTHTGAGTDFDWTAPAATGTYLLYCNVSGGGGTASKSVEVQVSNLAITSLTAVPGVVYQSGVSTITCAAADPDSPVLTYDWTVPGSIPYTVLSSSRIAWTAPEELGTYEIGCKVTNSAGDTAQREVEVRVATGPVIISVTAEPGKVMSGRVSSLVCLATAPGGVALTYAWSAASGTHTGAGTDFDWTAPAATGTYLVYCEASGGGGTASKSVEVRVINLVINALTAVPGVVEPAGVSTITCAAADPDSPVLDYNWRVPAGTYELLASSRIAWTAPGDLGTYTIGCEVTNSAGGSAQRDVELRVATGPVIISITSNPLKVPSGGKSSIVCLATAPGGVPLTYAWSAASGTHSGSGTDFDWTAPAATGTYLVYCNASGGGGADLKSVEVQVSNLAISALTAVPGIVYQQGVSTITCAAADPDSPVLDYHWQVPAGTYELLASSRIAWTAPGDLGTYTIGCKVTNSAGDTASREVDLRVATGPVIISMIPSPARVLSGSTSTIVCLATAPGSVSLTYVWSAASGTAFGSGPEFTWTAPAATGTYLVYCGVTGGGGEDSESVAVQVSNLEIRSLTADPAVVGKSEVSTITCTAADPEDPVLTYNWVVPDGAYAVLASSRIAWTAPPSTGGYKISCEVSNSAGDKAKLDTTVLVASGPVITSLLASPGKVLSGGKTDIVCRATAPGNVELTYAWSAASGTPSGTGDKFAWTAPAATGTYLVYCAASGGGGTASQSLEVKVSNLAISALTAVPVAVEKFGISTITCTAADPDSPVLNYAWTIPDGTGYEELDSSRIAWVAPAATGTYSIGCKVSNSAGDTEEREVEVWVASGPVILSVIPSPLKVLSGGESNLVCLATAPGSVPLTYTWTAASGTPSGAGTKFAWTAPAATGTYLVYCAVSDGAGGAASQSAEVRVSNLVLSSLAAVPAVVEKLGVSTVTCTASDPESPVLTYNWEVPDGSYSVLYSSRIAWTAPAATGTYTVGCEVVNSAGDSESSDKEIWVASGPVILSVIPEPAKVQSGATTGIVCKATAPGGVPLTYAWSAASGTPSGTGDRFAWTAPAATGTYLVYCAVSDGAGGAASQSAEVLVSNLVMNSLTAVPAAVEKLGVSTITCDASDPQNPVLSYKWTVPDGTYALLSSSRIAWTAPAATETYTISCEAKNGSGDSVAREVSVWVASGPVILSVTPSPAKVLSGGESEIVCLATAPGGVPLTYAWTASSGTPSGTGEKFPWTAPAATGTYLVYCAVSDGAGGTASQSAEVRVSNLVMNSLTAVPGAVEKLGISTITCDASDPQDPSLTYEWTVPEGSSYAVLESSRIAWAAPPSTGVYTLGCMVANTSGDKVQRDVTVWVASGPVILSVSAGPAKVLGGGESDLVCKATAPAGVPLSYVWTAASGTPNGTGEEFTWTAPAATGTYFIYCAVSDGAGGTASEGVQVLVSNLVLTSVTAVPQVVDKLGVSTITCAATDPENPVLDYEWEVPDGTFEKLESSRIAWTGPETIGAYKIGCAVSNGGDIERASVDVWVATGPVITSITATPPGVPSGKESSIVCKATAPGGVALTYAWSAASGTHSGTGDKFAWTAPAATGTYLVYCEASGGGGTDSKAVEVLVSNLEISALTAVPEVVNKSGVSTITCTAADPDSPALTYDWVIPTGSSYALLSSSRIAWTAPSSTGTYAVGCEVSNTALVKVRRNVDVQVATGPVILSITPDPAKVLSGGESSIICKATAPGSVPLSYSWTAASGTPSGIGREFLWTAPAATGTYLVYCAVAGGGGEASQSVEILVSNLVLSSLAAVPEVVDKAGVSTITCTAADPQNPVLNYDWTVPDGTAYAVLSSSRIAWTAPAATGTYTVNCAVSNGTDTEEKDVEVWVASGPVITSMTAAPDTVASGKDSHLVCKATAPAGIELTYAWSAASGTHSGSAAAFDWTAPMATGTYLVYCAVSGGGETVSQSLAVRVNNPPVISALSADPEVVGKSGVSTITCTAADPDSPFVDYDWAVDSGTYSEIVPGQIAWRAPESTGTYAIECKASDGEVGLAKKSVDVWVATGPVITSIIASPAKVSTGTPSSLVCVATSPGSYALTYSWTADSGTPAGSGDEFEWMAPADTGTYLIYCAVSGDGGMALQSIEVLVNNPPVIHSVEAAPVVVEPNSISTLTCTATDPDNPVIFHWTSEEGALDFSAFGVLESSRTAWTAPASTGIYTIGCEATDGEGGEAKDEVQVWVATGPVITSLKADPPTVSTGAGSNIVCLATASGSGVLTYVWSASSGTPSGSGQDFAWTAPLTTGTALISCEVSVNGGTAWQSIEVLINNPPVISALTSVPYVVSTGAVAELTCAAADPDGEKLSYTWSSVEGSTLAVSADSATWTAPVATGSYQVTCAVSDGHPGGVAQKNLNITVATGPVITLMTAPATLARLESGFVVCEATVAGGGDLVYAWSKSSGTITAIYPSSAAWTAPNATGTYSVTCEVSVAGGGSALASSEILVNGKPVLSALTAVPSVVSTGAVSELTCAASDPDGEELGYSWSWVEGSTLTVSADSATWTAPVTVGTYSVTCVVSDGHAGGIAQKSVTVTVSTGATITLMTAPESVARLESAFVVCEATSPVGGELVYSWTKSSGSITAIYPSSITWTAPNATGTYSVTCEVGSDGGGSALASRDIIVNGKPVVSTVTAAPSVVSTGAVSSLSCAASDPDGEELTYTWSSVEGSTLVVSADSATWTAPVSTGEYSVTCAVSDGHAGGMGQKSVQVIVATSPVITLLKAPETVPRLAGAFVVCEATSPAGGELVYAWSKSSGTITEIYPSSAAWTAPNATGTYSVSCEVSVAGGGSAFGSVAILVNGKPEVSAVTAAPAWISTGAVSALTCAASDPDGEELTYTWSSVEGSTLVVSADSATWTAPVTTGSYSVTCLAADGHQGGTGQKSVTVQVATGPVITLMTSPEAVARLESTFVICEATSPGGGELVYTWTKSSGTITEIFPSSAAWTAPNATGTYSVTCEVGVGGGGSAQESREILVNSRPEVSEVKATPALVSTGAVSALTCLASDPDGEELTYTWSSVEGSTLVVSADSATWTAPVSTGEYSVTCAVSDGHPGGQGQRNATILVATGPVITLMAAPLTMARLESKFVVCEATAPDGGALVYTWTKSSGTITEIFPSSAAWTAPNATGTYSVTCEVGVDGIGSASESREILVNSKPEVSAVTAAPALVSTGAVSALTCLASDPDGEELTYTWSSVEGSTLVVSADSATWTAPVTTGSYSVTCSASDGHAGGTGQKVVMIQVATGPAITLMTAPETMARLESAFVVCEATAPDSGELLYTWTKSSGSITAIYASSIAWTAPNATGTYSVTCEVGVPGGGSASESREILVNGKPSVSAVTAAPSLVSTGSVSQLTCAATDPDGEELTYTWSSVAGSTLVVSVDSATWTAPVTTGSYSVTCEASDGHAGGTGKKGVTIQVATGPAITLMTAPDTTARLESAFVVCEATAPDGGALVYTWTKSSGSITAVYASSIAWTAPNATGTYSVTCEVGVDGGGSVSESREILVNSKPEVSALRAVPTLVSTGSVSELSCVATDPDGEELTYTWSSVEGSTLVVSADSATWTAPVTTGSYSVTCEASDGHAGGTAQKNVTIQVATGPAITLMTAPETLARLESAFVVCEATAPDSGELLYTWTKSSGNITAIYASSIAWTAPDATGTYRVTCEVGVAGGGSASESREILVNSKPAVSAVMARPMLVSTGSVSQLSCLAADPDGEELTYAWSSVEGSTLVVSADSATWTAPLTTGSYSVTCEASDGHAGGTGQKSVTIQVATGPAITLMTAPETMARLESAFVVCEATAPDGGELVYTWTKSSGSITAVYASSISWTAPDSTGTYSITCEVGVEGHGSVYDSREILVNGKPSVSAVTAVPTLVSTGSVSQLTCEASDPDGEELTYTWSSVEGSTLVVSADSATWTAPVTTGSYSVTCEVSDGHAGGTAQKNVTIQVATGPAITLMTAPEAMARLESAFVVCEATAPDGGEMVYTWTKSSGTITAVFPSSATWTAPNATGTYSVTCEVGVDGRGSVFESREILVNSKPAVSGVTAVPTLVSTGGVSELTCAANDPDGEELTYTWSSVEGSTLVVSADSATWTAPVTTGSYLVTCEVSDGHAGGTAQKNVTIQVATGPAITLMTAPETMARLESAFVVCEATAPDGDELVYTWTESSGTITAVFPSSAAWTAPNATGTYSVTCEVGVAGHGSASESRQILVNTKPAVTEVTAVPALVYTGSVSQLTCAANDLDGEELTYTWSSVEGSTLVVSADSATWTAPVTTGSYSVTCETSDGHAGGTAQKSVTIQVATGPAITLMNAPETLGRLESTFVICEATAPESGVLLYTWTKSSGSITAVFPSSAAWTAPNATGTYSVTCEVGVDGRGSVFESREILVNSKPAVSGVTAAPSLVSTGSVSQLSCLATDPDGEELTYTWSSVAGSTLVVSADSATWTAPVTTGSYSVTCEASDGHAGGTAQKNVTIQVATGPAITLMTAPETAAKLSQHFVICEATAPDSGELLYTWTKSSGTITAVYPSSITWTAPDLTGLFRVTCEVGVEGRGSVFESRDILVNTKPAVNAVTASPSIISTGSVSLITCAASDADLDALTYSWSSVEGSTLVVSADSATWTAPVSTGLYSVTCSVSDNRPGGTAEKSVSVQVATGPLITNMSVSPGTVPKLGQTYIVCEATAPDNGAMAYFWSVSSGTIAAAYASSAAWTAPDATGTYVAGCEVRVAGRDSAFAYGELVVNTPPTLSALTAAPSLVSTGSVAALTCAASDPDGDELVYTWTSVEGSTLVVSADSATWTAPVSTGSYSVTCAVSDGKADGTAQLSVAVRVATGPVITLMNVNPDRVPKLGSSYVICEATAPDSGALVYTWTKSGGTITDVFPSSAAWQAPDSTGTYSVGCEVAVTGHGSVFDSRAIVVNTPPVMNWVTGQPDFISTMTVSTITCSASDADGDTLSYEWTALSGSTKAVAGDGSQVEWTSPASSGTYAITCKALDAQGGEAQLDENIEVSSIPVIDSLTADTAIQPPSLSTGAQTTLDCAARGPGGETVAYDWYASSGSTQSVAGNGHNMLWTAPVSTGTYSVTCAARGGAGFAQQSLPILVNNPPRILSVSADPATVSSGTVSTITCVAVHPDGPITYAWSKSTGTFNLLDPWRVEWTAPAAAGTYNIGCKATDEDGGFDDDSAAVTVTVRLNLAPTISLVAADPEVVSKGAVSTITCTAVDPENSALAYDWYASGGSTGTIAGGVSSITWTAPLVIGTYTVGCTVSDGEGGTDSDVGLVTVSTMPVISTVTATLDWVTPGSSVMLTCVAKGPDKEIPSYTWHADNGSLEAVSGHLEQITWTAPVSSGTYAVRCTATGAGGFAEADKHILVNTPPYKKAPLSAAPSLVSPLGISTVTCTVEDADSDPLTYTWQAQDGSTSPLSADASTVAWRAPASSGTYTITCTASDGKIGGVVTGSVDVLVGTAPVITGLTADPSSVLAGGVSTVTCSAYDPDSNDPLTYNWSASGGSLKAYVSSAAWTAPASSGTYSVTCEAQSGGGSAVAAVNITARFSRLWTRQPGSVANDAGYAVAVDTTSGNVYIAGEVNEHLEFGTTWYGSNDAFLSKYDTDGSVLWSVQLGSANVDQGRAAAVDTHGNVIIAGNSDRPLLLKDAFIVKYDPAGNMVWFRSTGTDTDDTAYGVAVDSAGSVYVVGETAGAFTKPYAGGASDIFMVKYSSAGALLKKYQYGTTGNDSAYAVAIDTSGYVYVTGRTGGRLVPGATYYGGLDSFLSKFDNSLNPVWTVQLGISAADIARGVTVDSDGKIWVTGYTNGNLAGPTNGGTDIFLARYDANGSTLTLKQLGTTAEDRGWAIAAYPGYVYISGEVGAAFPGNTYAGDADIFLAKYNNSGVEAWAQPQQYGSSAVSLDISYGLGADHDGNAFLAGKTMGEIDGNSQNGLSDIFVTKYSPDN